MNIGDIATLAYDAVSGAIEGVVDVATLEFDTTGAWDQDSRVYVTKQTTLTGRAFIGTASSITTSFPAYQTGPEDTLLYLEGFTQTPQKGWRLTFKGQTRVIQEVGDLVGGGSFFEVIAR